MRGRRRAAIIFLALAGVAVIVLATGIGAVSVSPGRVLRVFGEALGLLDPGVGDTVYSIIWKIRFPRVLLGFLIGASLATAGVSFQGLLQNPLADPYTIGVSSGAALGAMLGILFLPGSELSWYLAVPLCGFLGALLALFIVYQLGRVGGRLPVTSVLLAGVVVSSFFSALISLTMILAGEQLRSIFFWIAGGLGMRGWNYVFLVFPYFFAGLLVLLFFSRDLNIILLGEEAALSMGVEVERVKKAVLVTASLITAGAVSVSGMIGFVGLIVPHALRILIGPDHRFLLPVSVLGGGIFLVLADTFARTVMAPVEIPVGIITAFIGAPFFMLLLRKHRKKYRF